jgi:hypothetical protein
VTVSPGGATTTGATGQYTVGNVPVGSGTVALSHVPGGCQAPAAKPYSVTAAGQVVTVDFTVTCTAPPQSGTVSGTVTRSTGGAVAGATVTVAPGGSATTNASGQYAVGSVPIGSGTVSVSNLPGGCQVPAAKPYTVASGGQMVTVDFIVTCQTAGPNSLRGRWTVSGATATLEFRAGITQGTLGAIVGDYNVNSSRLQYTGSAAADAPNLPNIIAANPPQTKINFGAFTTDPSGVTGDVGVIKLIFTILPGAPQTIQGTITGFGATNPLTQPIVTTFQNNITIDPLTLP